MVSLLVASAVSMRSNELLTSPRFVVVVAKPGSSKASSSVNRRSMMVVAGCCERATMLEKMLL